jgi:hypothetical protein
MSVGTNYTALTPSESAFAALPPGNQYSAEIDAIYQRNYASTKDKGVNVVPREMYLFDVSNRNLELFAQFSGGLDCKNTNMLGARPNLDPSKYSGSCSSVRYPQKNSGVFNAAFANARQGSERYIDKIGMFNYSMPNIEVSTSLLGAPPQSVQMDAAQGTVLNRDGGSYVAMTGLKGLNYQPSLYSDFYSPLPAATVTTGSCVSQQSRSVSLCNNGQ